MITPERLKEAALQAEAAHATSPTPAAPACTLQVHELDDGGMAINTSMGTFQAYLDKCGLKIREVKTKGDRTYLYPEACPVHPDHGSGTDTALIYFHDGRLGFKCQHSRCAGVGWKDVRRLIDPAHEYLSRRPENRGSAPVQWEPPIPFGEHNLAVFPIKVIPEPLAALRDFCEAVAESCQVPIDLPAMLALAIGSAALSKRIEVHVQGDHVEPVNVYAVVVLRPAERKSAVFKHVERPLSDYEREEAERLAPIIRVRERERALLETTLKHCQAKAAKSVKDEDRATASQRIEELAAELEATPSIVAPRFIADDSTPERLSSLMHIHEGRIAVLAPEGDVFDMMAGRYGAKNVQNLGVYLKGHAGDDIRVDRVGRPPEFVRDPALTMGLAVQPEVLRGLTQRPSFRGRGLLARYLYSLPSSLLGRRRLKPTSVPGSVKTAYADMLRHAMKLEPVRGEFDRPHPHVVRVGQDALAELDVFAERIERGLGDTGEYVGLRDWAGKLVGAVCRIAGIFHGLIHARAGRPADRLIDSETMLGAIAIGEYLIPHARAAFFEMGSDPAVQLAKDILAWIVDRRLSSFSRRDAYHAVRSKVTRVDEVVEPLRLLVDHLYVRPLETERPGPGRKPSPLYEVNPHADAHNAQNSRNRVVNPSSAHSGNSAHGNPA